MESWKKEKIRERDGNKCLRCGSVKKLRIIPLISPIISIKTAILPTVVMGLFCFKCRKLIISWRKGKIVDFPDKEFSKYCQIYHPGIFLAEQYLKSLSKK